MGATQDALSLASRAKLRLYQELLARIQPMGRFREEIKKTSIHPIRGVASAGVHPRKQRLLVTIGSAKPIQSAGIANPPQVKNLPHNSSRHAKKMTDRSTTLHCSCASERASGTISSALAAGGAAACGRYAGKRASSAP